jgi:hypothetical protein
MCCLFAWGSYQKREMMKASGKNIKYLLFSSALFISIWISSFLVIPVTGIQTTHSDILSAPVAYNPK